MRRLVVLVAGLALLAGLAAAASGRATQAEARWVVTDLGTLGGSQSEAVALNESGQVIGMSTTAVRDFHFSGFLWQRGRMTNLGNLGAAGWTWPRAINGRGQIVGWSAFREGDRGVAFVRAFLWEKGKMNDLGTLGGKESRAVAISERGQVIGQSDTKKLAVHSGVPLQHAFLWENGRLRDLGTLGGQESSPSDINDRGQVVGEADTKGGASHAFLWQKGKMTDLGALRGRTWSWAAAINNKGQVVGWTEKNAGQERAFLWDKGKMRDLGAPPGRRMSVALEINDRGQVLGYSYLREDTRTGELSGVRCFLWERGTFRDLGTIRRPYGINDRGQVVGNDVSHATLWENGGTVDLGTLPGATIPGSPGSGMSRVAAINNRGQIVGWSDTREGHEHAVLWTLKR